MNAIGRYKKLRPLLLLGIAFGVLITGCGVQGAAPSGQSAFQQTVIHDRRSLFKGLMAYSTISAMDVGDNTGTFELTIYGSLYAASPFTLSTSGQYVPAPIPKEVYIGADIGAKLICTGIRCDPYEPERQPVISNRDHASWVWGIEAPDHPGIAVITLEATQYDRNTDTVLHSDFPIVEHVAIKATLMSRIVAWVRNSFNLTLAIIGALGVGTIATFRRRIWKRARQFFAKFKHRQEGGGGDQDADSQKLKRERSPRKRD